MDEETADPLNDDVPSHQQTLLVEGSTVIFPMQGATQTNAQGGNPPGIGDWYGADKLMRVGN